MMANFSEGKEQITPMEGDGATYRFLTDAAGRRTKRCTTSDCNVQGTGDRYYIFYDDKVIGEISGTTPFAAYSWGPDGVASERLLTGTPKSLFYCYGPQGETRNLTDSGGTVVDTYRYNAYGKTLATTGSNANPFRYGGKFGYYTDTDTGLQLAGARWYSPNAFRWTSRDPIHYKGGDNLRVWLGVSGGLF